MQRLEVMKSELELFTPKGIQNQTVAASYQIYTPISAIQPATPIQFVVPGSQKKYLDLSQSYITLTTKITKADNTNPDADTVGPINLPVASCFSDVEIELGDKVISDPNGLYPFRAVFETLLTHSPDSQTTQLQMGLWAKDKAGQMEEYSSAANGANTGLVARAAFYNRGVEVELLGRLHADIFHQDKLILGNVNLKVKLTPSHDNFILVTPAPGQNAQQENYKFKIIDAKLHIFTHEVSNSLAIAHELVLKKHNAHYPIRRVTMKHISLATGVTNALHDNIYMGNLPERIVMALVKDRAMNGSYQSNPFYFHHFGLTHAQLTLDGIRAIPGRAFTPDFANNKYIREYACIFDGMGLLFGSNTIAIDRSEYAKGYTIFVFDLTPDKNSGKSLSVQQEKSVRLELKFSAATTETINVLLYGEFDSDIEIDQYRNVITNF